MREGLLKILREYLLNINKPFAGNILANYIRHDMSHIIKREACITDQYLIKGSAGQGNWAEIPWICIFDKIITTSAEYGYYIAYLFDARMRGVYISLNQGWTQYEKKYKPLKIAQEEIKNTSLYCQDLIKSALRDFSAPSINLNAKNRLGKGYELGNICAKYYSKDSIPTDNILIDDLRNLIGVYRELKGHLSGYSIIEKKVIKKTLFDKTDIEVEEEKQEKKALKLSTSEKKKRALEAEARPSIDVKTKHYPRNPYVSAYAKDMAQGKCDLCGKAAPFVSKVGEPYLECHHIIERSENGPDTIENTVALCPNCHRKMHNLKLEEDKVVLQKKAMLNSP